MVDINHPTDPMYLAEMLATDHSQAPSTKCILVDKR